LAVNLEPDLPGGAEPINDFIDYYGTAYTLATVAWLLEFRAPCAETEEIRAKYEQLAAEMRKVEKLAAELGFPNAPDNRGFKHVIPRRLR
jgi:hypothetical protein